MMPLTLANIGEENMIHKVGGSPEMHKHLEDMGFVAGGSVTVISTIGGNLIVTPRNPGWQSAGRWQIKLWCKGGIGF